MDNHQIKLNITEQRVVMNTEKSRTELKLKHQVKLSAVTMGKQGPVGTVAENVLARAVEAEAAAKAAQSLSNQVAEQQSSMVSDMTNTLEHFIGAIEAQNNYVKSNRNDDSKAQSAFRNH